MFLVMTDNKRKNRFIEELDDDTPGALLFELVALVVTGNPGRSVRPCPLRCRWSSPFRQGS